MPPPTSSSELLWHSSTPFAYLGVCITALVGLAGITWHVQSASADQLSQLHEVEVLAIKAGDAQSAVAAVEARDEIDRFRGKVGNFVGVCAAAIALGMLVSLLRFWLRPPTQSRGEVCFCRLMLLALAWGMGGLYLATVFVLDYSFD